jgi:hypothetical protein
MENASQYQGARASWMTTVGALLNDLSDQVAERAKTID